MRKLLILAMLITVLIPQVGFVRNSVALDLTRKFMKLSPSEYLELKQSYKRLPVMKLEAAKYLLAARDIRGLLPAFSCDRNQGSTGTCWVWGCTSALEVEINKKRQTLGLTNDRISIQYLDSNYVSPSGKCSFCGGAPDKFVNFYNSKKICIPWSNTNASFMDGSDSCAGCPSNIAASSISTTPNYYINSMSAEAIYNTTDSESVKIAKIRTLLDNNVGVIFGFHWQGSQNFTTQWHNQTETDIWNPVLGNSGDGNGHMVFCFGYNAIGRYWRILNSWGCDSGNRPNGEFRLPWDGVYGDDHYAWFKLNTDIAVPPVITALAATEVKATGARINGKLVTKGTENTAVYYQYRGETQKYGSMHLAQYDSSSGTYYIKFAGLTIGTKYYYRFVAKTTHFEIKSNDMSFTTLKR